MFQADTLIIGGGPSGLAAAIALRRAGVKRVVVVDREQQAGGVPRHCNHTGFGIRDLRRVLTGGAYARQYVRLAHKAGVEILTGTMVTHWIDAHTVRMTSPSGITDMQANAIVLATGCRERPRSAWLVPGSRPAGVFTTGALQQWVYLKHLPVGKRAVIVGAEHVSFSAVMTLRHAGVDVAAMVTEHARHQSFFAYKFIAMMQSRFPLMTGHCISRINGSPRVQSVEITSVDGKHTTEIECDTVVFTGNWIPDHELARSGGLTLDSASKSPQVDTLLRTSTPGIFAVGNLNHAAETADVAALDGWSVARRIVDYQHSGAWRTPDEIPLEIDAPVQWISPQVIAPEHLTDVNRPFFLRVKTVMQNPTLEIRQGQRVLWRKSYRYLLPNLPVHIPPQFVRSISGSDPVRVFVQSGTQEHL